MQKKRFSISARLKSFVYAYNGLKILLKNEHNAWIHIVAAFIAVAAGIVLHISAMEWLAVIFTIGFVITMEIINSSIEYLADYVSPGYHEQIKKVKDLSAAAVFVAAVTAFIVGLIIFIPKLL